jgi:prepilin-type N-terminal cleavage/methylation domain-containing protein
VRDLRHIGSSPTGRRLLAEDGFTLFELLVVTAIMLVVVVGLTTTFASGTKSEIGISKRQDAQQEARLALDRMREDIHCANNLTSVSSNAVGGFTLALTETYNVCATVESQVGVGGSTVSLDWCTVPDAAHPGTFQLWRNNGTCDGTTGTMVARYITAPSSGWPANATTTATSWDGNIWPTPRTCAASSGFLPTVAVQMAVNPDGAEAAATPYELDDQIALRNAPRC